MVLAILLFTACNYGKNDNTDLKGNNKSLSKDNKSSYDTGTSAYEFENTYAAALNGAAITKYVGKALDIYFN